MKPLEIRHDQLRSRSPYFQAASETLQQSHMKIILNSRGCSKLRLQMIDDRYPLKDVLMRLRLKHLAVTSALIFFLALTLERPAYGYTDPGSALLVFQSLSAFITGSLFYFRKRLKKLIGTVKRPAKRSG
jgi:hypothetical protein